MTTLILLLLLRANGLNVPFVCWLLAAIQCAASLFLTIAKAFEWRIPHGH